MPGVNLAQGVESFVLAFLGEGDAKKALIYGGSTLLATFVGDLGMSWFEGADGEKFGSEPIVAGVLAAGGMYVFNKKEKNGGIIKPFARGFAYTGATAGLNSLLASNYGDRKVLVRRVGDTYYDKAGQPMSSAQNVYVSAKDYKGPNAPLSGYGELRAYTATVKEPGFFETNALQ